MVSVVDHREKRFEREGQMWASFSHINILPFFGMIDLLQETYLVSPWMEVGDLTGFISTRLLYLDLPLHEQPLDQNHALYQSFKEINVVRRVTCYSVATKEAHTLLQIAGIASGLAYLHSRDVVHGDLKAANVLLDEKVQAVLCDFGMAKALDNVTSSALQGAGSLRWMSPELMDDSPKSTRSDVYAFGMTIVEVHS